MVIESSQQPVKRGRGRPRKAPIAELPSHKNTKKSIPMVAPSSSSLSWEEELVAFEKRTDRGGILTMIIFFLGIVFIGGGMYFKLHQADHANDDISPQTQLPQKPEQNGKPVPTKPTQTNTGTSAVVQEYFSRINNGQFDSLVALEDSSFRSLATLRNYFNINRLQVFSKNLLGGLRIESFVENTTDPVLKRNPTLSPKAYDFTLVYTLKSDEKEYRDLWRAYTVQKDSGTIINGFVYQGTGISQSPFFQFTKFGIK